MTVELSDDGTPVYAVSWSRYKAAQHASNTEPLPASLGWLHPAAGTTETPRGYTFRDDLRTSW
jgi:hypothetical protein